jgi:hypothetical protein
MVYNYVSERYFIVYVICSIRGNDCGDEAAVWLSTALSRQCRLIEMDRSVNRQMKISSGNNMLSLSNEAQYLLVNYSSLHYLHDVLADKLGSENTVRRHLMSHTRTYHSVPAIFDRFVFKISTKFRCGVCKEWGQTICRG